MYGLAGRKVIVTGAAQGIGRVIAQRMAREGCDVGIVDLDGAGAEATAADITGMGVKAYGMNGDVSDAGSVALFMETLIARLGGLDILINNAGVLKLASMSEMTIGDWRQTFRVNVDGMFLCSQMAVPQMTGGGRIVNLASWMGKKGVENYGAYCATKSAAISMTQTLALEVASRGITVNAVCPGVIVETKMREESDAERASKGMPLSKDRASTIPLGRVGLPEDVARVVTFLASDEASYMTGQAINITGGLWMN